MRRRKTQKSSHSKYYGKELLPELLTFQVLRRNSWVHVPLVSRPCIGRQHKWTKMYSLFLVITQSGNNLMLPLHTLCEFFVCFTNWINNAIEEKITWQKQGRKKREIIDTESHLILSVKFQHWGFAGNLKKKSKTLVWNVFLQSVLYSYGVPMSSIPNYKHFLQTVLSTNWQKL